MSGLRQSPAISRRAALRLAAGGALVPAWPLMAAGARRPAKPPVPPGRDPGGVAVAIIGEGVDYRRPEIAARLARDGEGELVGWDLIDEDRRPYNPSRSSEAARILVAGAPAARIAVFRAHLTDQQASARAIGMAAAGLARIIVVNSGGRGTDDPLTRDSGGKPHDPRLPLLYAAGQRYSGVLFIAPNIPMYRRPPAATAKPDNLLLISECDGNPPIRIFLDGADIATCASGGWPPAPGSGFTPDFEVACAHIAALAARRAALEPDLDGAGLANQIASLTNAGFIYDPDKYYPSR